MNILILVSALDFGGAQKQAVMDANMMASRHNIYLGMFKSGEFAKEVDSRVKTVTFEKPNYFTAARQIASFVKKEEIHVIHNHLYAPMIISALASLMKPVPVLWHFHGHHFEVRKWPLNLLSRLPTVKQQIFVCAALKNYFEKAFSYPKKKLRIVYNSAQCRKNEQAKKGHQPIVIGFVGRVVKLKRIDYLINLAAALREKGFRDFEIRIVGDGPAKATLEKKAHELQLNEHLIFTGFRSDLENLYNQMDLFILPSEEEALSIALIDAQNCGLPSLAFDVGGNSEIIRNGESGYIVDSETDLQQKALNLCRDKALRQRMGKKAIQHAKVFNEAHHQKELEKMYQQTVRNKTTSPSLTLEKG